MRIVPMIAVALALQSVCSEAGAQSKPVEKSPEKTELRFELSPRFGETLLDGEGNQPVDESEARLAVKFIRPVTKDIALEAIPLAAYSPQVYDDSDPSSQLRVGLELRRRLTIGPDGQRVRYTSFGQAGLEPFVRYTPSLGFKGAFGDHSFFDNNVALGARLENDVWFHCRQGWIIAMGLGCGYERDRKVAVRIVPQLQYTVSDQMSRRRLTPQVEARIVVPLRDLNIRMVSGFENRRFTELRTPTGDLQRDGRVTASISFDFVPFIRKFQRERWGKLPIVNDFTLELGASYVRNRSNNPARNFDRIFFVPAFTYTRQLD